MRESGERVTRQLSAHVQPQGRTVFAHKTEIPNPVICSTQERLTIKSQPKCVER